MQHHSSAPPLPRRGEALARLAPVAALVGSMVSLTIGTSFAKSLFPVVGAPGTITLRIALAALLLAVVRRPWRHRLGRRDAAAVGLYGLVLGAMNLMFYMSLRTIPLGLAIAIEFAGPLTVALVASRKAFDFVWLALAVVGLGLLLPLTHGATSLDPAGIGFALVAAVLWGLYIVCGQRIGHLAGGQAFDFVWLALAVVGLGLLLPLTHGATSLDPAGIGFALAAAVLWGLYIICGQRIGHLAGGQAVTLGLSVAALLVLPFGVASAGRALLEPFVLASGLVVAVLSSAVPYSLEIFALRHLPRQTFGVLLSLEPAIGSLAAFAILGEHLTPVEWLAIGCIVTASSGSAVRMRSHRRTPPRDVCPVAL